MGKDLDKLNERAESAFERIKRERFGPNFGQAPGNQIYINPRQTGDREKIKEISPNPKRYKMMDGSVLEDVTEKKDNDDKFSVDISQPDIIVEENLRDKSIAIEIVESNPNIFDILDYLDSSSLSDNIKAAIGILLASKEKEDIEKAILYLEKELKK